MRRKDREITDMKEIAAIIRKCGVCRVALADGNVPYVVPMNFGFAFDENGAEESKLTSDFHGAGEGRKLTLYFHGAGEGRKHEIIKKNPLACFEMDCSHRIIDGDDASQYTMEYESVIGTGTVSYCTDENEKRKALTCLMKQYAPEKDFAFPSPMLAGITVFKLEADEIAGKRNLRKNI